MNAEARVRISVLRPQDWQRLGYLNVPAIEHQGLGLTNDIHPLFLCWRPKPIPYDGVRYDKDHLVSVAGGVLRQASAILTSPGSLDVIYNILYARRGRVVLLNHPLGLTELTPEDPLGPEQRDLARRALNRLAESRRLYIEDSNDKGSKMGDSYAYTISGLGDFPDGISITDTAPGGNQKKGAASSTFVNRGFMTTLATLHAQQDTKRAEILTLETKMAMTLCHEVTHACNNAVNEDLLAGFLDEMRLRESSSNRGERREPRVVNDKEPFGKGQDLAELGWHWEQAVFGGTFTYDPYKPDHPLQVAKWPNFLSYGKDLPCRRGKGQKWKMTNYVVPMYFIRNLHRQEFWEEVDPNDKTALQIHKMVGIRTKWRKHPDAEEGLTEDATWDANNSDEGLWPENDTERYRLEVDLQLNPNPNPRVRVSRHIPGDLNNFGPDPSASFANETNRDRVQRLRPRKEALQRLQDEAASQASQNPHLTDPTVPGPSDDPYLADS